MHEELVSGMANLLQNEKSPYLRQHADNPVEWLPFSEEAFQRAKEADIPIFLSIGYSTCHWCHVMNRESFSDPEVADALRGRFIAVKVDREERPEVDRIAMTACQLMTGSGGWPLTLVLTPDKRPFFAGTYFPKEAKFGRPGLLQILEQIWDLWQKNRAEAERLSIRVEEAVQSYLSGDIKATGTKMKGDRESLPDLAYGSLVASYDRDCGGFGTGMKFPSPHLLTFLLRYSGATGVRDAAEMAVDTLHAMRKGGINDQVGGGFHRYATDRQWLIPHYEKMACDQALLLTAFTEGYQITGDHLLKREAIRIAEYIRTDLGSPEGLFYTAEDAESGGEEGGFYLWSGEEIRSALVSEDRDWAAALLLREEGELIRQPLSLTSDPNDQKRLNKVREQLALVRKKRPRPFRDEKILLDANAMIISSLARAGYLLSDPALIEVSITGFHALQKSIRDAGGELFHTRIDESITSPANLSDYAELIGSAISLHQATMNTEYLLFAIDLTNKAIVDLYYPEKGFFWFEKEGGAFFRTRDLEDSDGPSGNAVMLHNLFLLHRITGDIHFQEVADMMQKRLMNAFLSHPGAYIHSISSYLHQSAAATDIITTGDREIFADAIRSSRNLLITHLHLTPDTISSLKDYAPKVLEYPLSYQEEIAYLCRQTACMSPITDPKELRECLNAESYL
ncbi:MAG: thioredoxin domain-containing protein [Methanocalculus sp.]|uniref:thioredoxin domain-containing protein n=1 Tax=Methanocalculus sp. TaxID=2004547 RepID=UPI00271CD69B|nr:thioredoxin domain-containing protein [Methanocalculus sp.]MDO9540515.1 thioredoxin domain-containing protein [Methanocalculus sp.]